MIGLIRNLALLLDNHIALRENGLIAILVQLMNKAYQDSNTRHVQGAPAGYMVSKSLYYSCACPCNAYICFKRRHGQYKPNKVVECLICNFNGLFILTCHWLL